MFYSSNIRYLPYVRLTTYKFLCCRHPSTEVTQRELCPDGDPPGPVPPCEGPDRSQSELVQVLHTPLNLHILHDREPLQMWQRQSLRPDTRQPSTATYSLPGYIWPWPIHHMTLTSDREPLQMWQCQSLRPHTWQPSTATYCLLGYVWPWPTHHLTLTSDRTTTDVAVLVTPTAHPTTIYCYIQHTWVCMTLTYTPSDLDLQQRTTTDVTVSVTPTTHLTTIYCYIQPTWVCMTLTYTLPDLDLSVAVSVTPTAHLTTIYCYIRPIWVCMTLTHTPSDLDLYAQLNFNIDSHVLYLGIQNEVFLTALPWEFENGILSVYYLYLGNNTPGSLCHFVLGKILNNWYSMIIWVSCFPGLEILMTCYDRVLSTEWHKVSRHIIDLGSKGKGSYTRKLGNATHLWSSIILFGRRIFCIDE